MLGLLLFVCFIGWVFRRADDLSDRNYEPPRETGSYLPGPGSRGGTHYEGH